MGKEGESGENYLILQEEVAVTNNKIINTETLNCIDCTILKREGFETCPTLQKGFPGKNKDSAQNETLNHVNISLISAPCQVPESITITESTDIVETDISEEENSLGWSKLTKIL